MTETTVRNLKAVLEYDGSAYVGWARQKNGLGIQELVEQAIAAIVRENVIVEGSGRTDAGVHALGQVASFAIKRPIPAVKLRLALNAVLPPDVAIRSLEEVDPAFHARKSARSKTYRYVILNGRARRPHARHTSYHFPQELDADAMAIAARHFVGTHDFTAFAREADRKESCVRTILDAGVRRDEEFLNIGVTGTGFLYNMVRIITGTLVEVGLGKRAADSIPDLLRSKERDVSGFTVPPHGLPLVEVVY